MLCGLQGTTTKKLIENVQECFTKQIIDMKNMEYEQRLKRLKLPILEYRRARGDMTETFKFTCRFYGTQTTSSLFKLNAASAARDHPYMLPKNTVHSNLYAHFLLLTEL